MDAYIIDAWERRGDGEDDDAYEGRISLGPPNNVAAAYARKDQCAAPATTPLPISANEESVCAAGSCATLQTTPISIPRRTVA